MAETANDPNLFWVDPEERGVFPLDRMVVSRSLAKAVRSDRFCVHVDRDFPAVISACAAAASGRPQTWINDRIRLLYGELFHRGHVHTVEAYENGALAGGLYGVSLGGAFFGESMFHRSTDASKVSLLHLAARLIAGGFSLLDTQFVTPHLAALGAIGITRAVYHRRLDAALRRRADFFALPNRPLEGSAVLDALRQRASP